MKFRVTMKNPDALDMAITHAVSSSIEQDDHELIDEEHVDDEISEIKNMCSRWFHGGEYLTVEVDTEEGTCIVVAQS